LKGGLKVRYQTGYRQAKLEGRFKSKIPDRL